jgi:hypothetical protein
MSAFLGILLLNDQAADPRRARKGRYELASSEGPCEAAVALRKLLRSRPFVFAYHVFPPPPIFM